MESILNSIKELLGGCAEDNRFDTDIITYINTQFTLLEQKGVTSEPGFQIEDDTATWNDYLKDFQKYNYIKTYIYLKVKLIFDPPANATVLKSMESQVAELDWFIDSKFNYENRVVGDKIQNGVI